MPDDQKRGSIDGLIEKAMSRLAERSPEAVADDERRERQRLGLGRRDYDQALARRLDEIRAMGRSGQAPRPPSQSATAEPASRRRCIGSGALLVAVLLSSAAGAAATWLFGPPAVQPAVPQVAAAGILPKAAAAPEPVAVPEPAKLVAESASIVSAPKRGDEDQVRELVERWRSAWASRDVDAYLACYGADFAPANGQQREAWAAARRKNIASRSSIIVATNGLTLERLDEQRMAARFFQDYASGSYIETAQAKTLLLVRNEAGWKIAGEWQGDAPAGALGTR
jgi:ketosteroid isomerase-like protein